MIFFLAFVALALLYAAAFILVGSIWAFGLALLMSLFAGRELIYRRDDRIRRGG